MNTGILLPEYARKARGYLKIEEREALFRLASKVPEDGLMLNIGIEYGASMVCLRAGNGRARLMGIDIDTTRLSVSDELQLDAGIISGDSGQLARDWNEPICLLFVDGDHGYRGVTLDTQYINWLSPEGIVMFHDCFDWSEPTLPHRLVPGVMQAVTDWYKSVDPDHWIEHDPIGTSRLFQRVE